MRSDKFLKNFCIFFTVCPPHPRQLSVLLLLFFDGFAKILIPSLVVFLKLSVLVNLVLLIRIELCQLKLFFFQLGDLLVQESDLILHLAQLEVICVSKLLLDVLLLLGVKDMALDRLQSLLVLV